MRSFGNAGCCGWDPRAPFHLGFTPTGYAQSKTSNLFVIETGGRLVRISASMVRGVA